MHTFIQQLTSLFSQHANPELAREQAAYLKNQFTFFGIKKPERAKLEAPLIKQVKITNTRELHQLVQTLWALPERDYQYTALAVLQKFHKLWIPETLALFETLIRTKSWWETVDDLAANHVGKLIQKYPQLVTAMDIWASDQNFWIRRVAILHQLRYKNKTDQERLFTYCRAQAHEKEFFIRKAIGWALREYSKSNPSAVAHFVHEHAEKLSPLSLREAKKYLL